MFLGHFGVALGAKTAAPKTSLGTLVLAAQLADLIWPILLLAGIEHVTAQRPDRTLAVSPGQAGSVVRSALSGCP